MDKMMRKARLQYWVDAHRNAQSVGLANSNGFRNRAFRSRCSTTGNRHAGDLILRRVHYFTPYRLLTKEKILAFLLPVHYNA